jgi:Tfp pilus assembly protein PilX
MVRNQTITSSVSASVSAELTHSLQQTLTAPRLRPVDELLGLPTTLRGFLLFVLATLLVCAGMALLVLTSIQIFQLRQQIATLQEHYRAIERENAELVWQIAEHTALPTVHRRALELGYDVPAVRHFVAPVSTPMLEAAATPSTAPVMTVAETADGWGWIRQQVEALQLWWRK